MAGLHALTILAAASAILMGLGQFVRPGREAAPSRPIVLSAALFFALGFILAHTTLLHLGLLPPGSVQEHAQLPVLFALGPLQLFYFRLVFNGRQVSRISSLLPHLLLPALALVALFSRGIDPGLLLAGGLFSISIYLFRAGVEFLRFFDRQSLRAPIARVGLWLFGCQTVTVLAYLGERALFFLGEDHGAHVAMWTGTLALSATVLFVYFAGQRYPELLAHLRAEAERARYRRSRLGTLNPADLARRLADWMETERAYLDEDLRLPDVARELELTTHQLSEVLNTEIGLPFKQYVNRFRVAEARLYLRETPDRSVLSIALAAGFNSKSAFNRAFQAETGQTPSEFRRSLSDSAAND